ncbi:MAG: class I SAM-dependent methyltransferase [Gammaproteobacteria bacterium]|nr:class I SAM-dependent methyltransferase [Gammaproteobacteria bacterium]
MPKGRVNQLGAIDDPEYLFHITSRKWFGIIAPIQSRYEFVSLLSELKKYSLSNILEIGTASGGTLFMYSRIANKDATLVSIDLPDGDFGGGYPTKKIPLYKSFAQDEQSLQLLRVDSHLNETFSEVEHIFSDTGIDFLFIDGDHTYNGVKSDFEMYSKLVNKNGFITFHDIVYAEGVSRFWNEIKNEYENTWEWIDDKKPKYGIGMLQLD